MRLTPLPNLPKHSTRLLLLLPPLMSPTPLILHTLLLPIRILPPPLVIRIPLGSRHAHLDEFARHVHADEIFLFVEMEELLPEDFGGALGDGDGPETPVGEEVGFVGLVG